MCIRLDKIQILIQQVWGGTWDSAFLTSSQGGPALLVLRPPLLRQQREETSPRGAGLAWPRINAATVGMVPLVFPVCPFHVSGCSAVNAQA